MPLIVPGKLQSKPPFSHSPILGQSSSIVLNIVGAPVTGFHFGKGTN